MMQCFPKLRRNVPAIFGPFLALTIVLLLALAGCSSGASPTSGGGATTVPSPQPSVQPTTRTVPTGTVLYRTDWENGLSGWTKQSDLQWQARKGQLHLVCGKNQEIFTQYRPTVTNYAVEVSFQVISVPRSGGNFGFVGQQVSGKAGFAANVSSLEHLNPFHGQIQAYINPPENASEQSIPADFFPGTQTITYRIEVQGNVLSFFMNGVRHAQVESTETSVLTNGPLGLNCGDTVLNIGTLTITAL
jgi:hypothetical protein